MTKMFIAPLGIAVIAFSTFFLSVPEADAQPGSRLCGISKGGVAFLVEVKQPKGKVARNKTNKACRQLAQKFRDKIPGGAKDWSYYERSECEGVAKAMGDVKGADICGGMAREKPYKVEFFKRTKKWTFKQLQ